jgi:signal peptidase I
VVTQADDKPKPEGLPKPVKRRSVGNIKAAANLLVKEAKRILKKHAARIAPAPSDAIRQSLVDLERFREARQWDRAEDECERLDELLHQHASFARKSPVRETFENVAIAVGVALLLRSCLYEPFKIPSGSMMPTLQSGDHIFVNKFAYGIQIPFTTHVVGEFMGAPARGDVIVFRYPVDESEDFIKRVIGLPGDTIRVEGNKVLLKRAGASEFEELQRRKLTEKCLDEAGVDQVPHCELYEETIDERTYRVRYMTGSDPRLGGQRRFGEWRVPDRHYLVMGDNRNQSHDSLAWTKTVEAVAADGLLSVKDLRDLTPEKLFTLVRPDEASVREDSSYDHIVYMADHASDAHGLQLAVWRDPALGSEVVYATLAAELPQRSSLVDLIAGDARLESPGNAAIRARITERGELIKEVAHRKDEGGFEAAIHLADARTVMQLRCGGAVCQDTARLAETIADVVNRWDQDHAQDARHLLEGGSTIRYSQHWTSRGPTSDKYMTRRFVNAAIRGEPTPGSTVRLRAWRAPDEPEAFLRDAALRAAGSGRDTAKQVGDDVGDDAWLASDADKFVYVRVDSAAQVVFALECGRQRCASETDMLALARTVQSRVPAASKDRTRMPELLTPTDFPAWKEVTLDPPPERYEYDRMRLDGSIRDGTYSLGLWVWRRPAEGLEGKIKALLGDLPGSAPDESVARGGFVGPMPVGKGTQLVFPVPATETVIRVECSIGLCPGPDEARALATRAYQKAQEAANFIDPTAERPRPYVPRGNVKGRADRIWLPFNRFWLPIR